jgi:hypothetical protein
VPTGAAGTFALGADATVSGAHDSSGFTQLTVPYASFPAAYSTTQQFTVGFGDWASTTGHPGSVVAVTSADGNTASGTSPWKASVFYGAVALDPAKTVQSVVLPSVTSSPLHVFAAAVGN